MLSLTSATIAVLSFVDPGPIDAFRANYSAAKASVEFTYKSYYGLNKNFLIKNIHKYHKDSEPAVRTSFTTKGVWEFDGTTERYMLIPELSEIQKAAFNRGETIKGFPVFPSELLYNGEIIAYRYFKNKERMITIRLSDRSPLPIIGPFTWWKAFKFPDNLSIEYRGIAPVRSKFVKDGRPCEVEIYEEQVSTGWHRDEIFYDLSVNYVPVYVRTISFNSKANKATLKEVYIITADVTPAGSFIPTEWYDTSFSINKFTNKYQNYDFTKVLVPDATADVGHFRVTKLTNIKDNVVRFSQLDSNHSMITPSSLISLKNNLKPSLQELTQLAGKSLRSAPKKRSAFSFDDLTKLAKSKNNKKSLKFPFLSILTMFSIVLAIISLNIKRFDIIKYKLNIFIGIIGTITAFPGCTNSAKPIAHLTASFSKDRLVYDQSSAYLPLTMILKNDGNQSLKIYDANGGCPCRQIENAKFPANLKPGESLTLLVRMQNRRLFEPQSYIFTFNTNFGNLISMVELYAFPNHFLSPESISLSELSEYKEETFYVTHKQIQISDNEFSSYKLSVPEDMSILESKINISEIEIDKKYKFQEKTYKIKINNFDPGLQKRTLQLKNLSGEPIIDVPVTWKRVQFLSCAPSKVYLGENKVRVFLVCPDDMVELTKILSTPIGVSAQLTSVREVTVALNSKAAPIINGFVEVATSLKDRPPLRIPVVRYTSKVESAD